MLLVILLVETLSPRSTLFGNYLRVGQAWWTLHVSYNRVAREVQNYVPVLVYSGVGCQSAWGLLGTVVPIVLGRTGLRRLVA